MNIRKRLKKYVSKYPRTVNYIARTLVENIRCGACGSPILRETNVKGYPYQCMNCDENKMSFETKASETPITDAELEQLVESTAELLLLDDEKKDKRKKEKCRVCKKTVFDEKFVDKIWNLAASICHETGDPECENQDIIFQTLQDGIKEMGYCYSCGRRIKR